MARLMHRRQQTPTRLSSAEREMEYKSIALLPFQRLVRAIAAGISHDIRFQVAAIQAMREASEAMLLRLFEQAYLYTAHSKRVTLMVRDMELVKRVSTLR